VVLAVVALALTLAAVLVPVAVAGAPFPSPFLSTASVAAYLTGHRELIVVIGFLTFGASVPLGIYAATIYAELQRRGVRVPGPGIAYFGGIAASVLLGVAGLLTWVLGQPVAGQAPATLHTLLYAVYATGGPGFVVALGLLLAGSAVPALVRRLTPRWLAWAGLVLAGLCELSYFALLTQGLAFLLPAGRFLGLAWLVVFGYLLPRAPRPGGRRTREVVDVRDA